MENLGSIFLKINQASDWKTNIYYGFRDGTGSHAHIVLISGAIEYYRDDLGINPLITNTGSVYFH